MRSRKGKRPSAGSKAAQLRAAAGLNTRRDFSSPNLAVLVPNGFTMRDEARNTASHQSTWGQDARLRQKPVAFVSAGFAEPLKDLKPPESPRQTVEKPAHDQNGNIGEPSDNGDLLCVQVDQVAEPAELAVDGNRGNSMPALQPTGQDDPDSIPGDDVLGNPRESPIGPPETFFFDLDGDKTLRRAQLPVDIPVRASSPTGSDSSEEVILFRGRSAISQRTTQENVRMTSAVTTTRVSTRDLHQTYISPKIQEPSLELQPPVERREKRYASQRSPLQATTYPEDDEEDEEDAILADYIANMAAESDNDLGPDKLHSFNSHRELGGEDGVFGFGSARDNGRATVENSSIDGADEATAYGINDDLDDDEDSDEESDVDKRGTASDMDDETLARLLSKQEELGMGADELMLYSGSYFKSQGGNRASKRLSRPQRLDTGSVAEAFSDMDLADWSQPEFQIPARVRRSKKPPGLLGKNINPDDLRVKYQSHMTLEDMKNEILAFLLSSAETTQFPPLDKQARKTLHELANKFKIKSQSTGKGDQRRPVLYRTKHTVKYAESSVREATNHVEMAAVRIKRKYFHRLDAKVPPLPRALGAGKRSGHKAVTYQEGEIVGASAPRLGQENKGHAMLEKMGWSQGMALGSVENKGILVPVAQVVKRSKAGLG
ncbi:hypothetical protein B0H66DRAFT_188079 [Apodospora peruviana]|uniref:Protein SQS1 n=1 Tax=Apodospora peruviana TaxID=516989 RepID=A0AAE0IBV2_9PEZI|nr:hypothetical protein B0H66DRAFT_188079 [Apodospora peruviana]